MRHRPRSERTGRGRGAAWGQDRRNETLERRCSGRSGDQRFGFPPSGSRRRRDDGVVRAVPANEELNLANLDGVSEELLSQRFIWQHKLFEVGGALLWGQLVIAGRVADPLSEATRRSRSADS